MITTLILQNVHFAVYVFLSLTLFSTAWVYFDTASVEKNRKVFWKAIAFILLSLSSAIFATHVSSPEFNLWSQIPKIIGLVILLIIIVKEPILKKPGTKSLAIFPPLVLISLSLSPIIASLSASLATIYYRKSEKGLEKQIKPLYLFFLLFSFTEIINFGFSLNFGDIPFWVNIFANFGVIWILEHLLVLISSIVLAKWAWGYLRFRIGVSLFITFIVSILTIFVFVTFIFTFLLYRNLEKDTYGHLQTDIKFLHYSLERLQFESLANASAVVENSKVKNNILNEDDKELEKILIEIMSRQNSDFLMILSPEGEIIASAEKSMESGGRIEGTDLIENPLKGNSYSGLTIFESPLSPKVRIVSAVPINDDEEKLLAVVATGFDIDSAFVDGVKLVTGLDISVFAGNVRSATTFLAADGKTRFIGTEESNEKVKEATLTKGKIYLGKTKVANQPYYASYSPLKDHEDKVLGMLFVGKHQNFLKETAQKSVESTFTGSVILMVLSLLPAYFLAKRISENAEA